VADSPVPLCSAAAFQVGPFQDLVSDLEPETVNAFLIEGTRLCEDECDRRLAPFACITESHRAEGMDPDEYTDAANLPMDLQGTLGRSYAYALGASTLVRHCWLNEYAPRYPEYWTYTDVNVTIVRSYGGSQILTDSNFTGPETDSGHLWFTLGMFIPIGSLVRVTYGGGYTVNTPAGLVRASKYMTASIIVRELQPDDSQHDPGLLHEEACRILADWKRP
jgi:hypothetical protein